MKSVCLVLATLVLTRISIACDCIQTPLENHIKTTAYIVVGEVTQLLDKVEDTMSQIHLDSTKNFKVKIQVINSYKGGLEEGTEIELGSKHSSCSMRFEKGTKYLLFLTKDGNTNLYFQRVCSYSEKMKNALSSIKIIEELTKYTRKK